MPTKISRQITTTAPEAALVARLRNTMDWLNWAGMTSARIERPGAEGDYPVGEIRIMTRANTTGHEEVLPNENNSVIRYRVFKGIPLKNYVGQVHIDDQGATRRITWSASYDAPPLTGWIFAIPLKGFFDDLLKGLVAGLEQPQS